MPDELLALTNQSLYGVLRGDKAALAGDQLGYVVISSDVMATVHGVPTMPSDTYRVEEDVTETLPDGRTIQVAAKGTAIPLTEARKLGLVKDTQKSGPTETKKAAAKKE